MYKTKRQMLNILRGQLDLERSSFKEHWRDLNDYILPRRGRFFISDVNKGDKRNQKIIDTTATLSARTLRSGMMSGITSPARPWFRLTTPSPEMAEVGAVKQWLHEVSEIMSNVFLKSNLYNTLPQVYGDLGVFGTAAMYIEEDFDSVIQTQSFPIGSYMLGKDSRGMVNVFFREFRMTVQQLLEKFGEYDSKGELKNWDIFSPAVKNAYDLGNYQSWFDVCHVIKPNDNYKPNSPLAKHKKFSSYYYEMGNYGAGYGQQISPTQDQDTYLSESGYDFFPVLAPRWEVTGEDVYGTDCPGMTALGDIKQLQTGEKRSMQAIEKMVNPPLVGPSSLKNVKVSLLPGDITYDDSREGQKGLRATHEVNFRVLELEQKQAQVRNRIQRAFFEDLFLMLANSDRRQITAREIDERHEEKLLALGPVLEQMNQDLLDPLIDITFDILLRQRKLPPAPEELQGMPLKVEYISIMAQAQKLVGISGLERFSSYIAQVATVNPTVLDKFDADQAIDVYADITSIAPGIVRTDEEVEEIRQQRAKQQQMAAMPQQIQQAASAAKDLSQSSLEGENALNALLGGNQRA